MVRDVSSSNDPKSARAAAANAYVLTFPLMLVDAVRRSHPIGFHQFHLVTDDSASIAPGLADDDPRVIVSSAWVDLRHEPVVLRLPNTHGRYINLTLIDSMGEPVASLGSRTGEDAGADVALVGPNWRGELASGLRAKRVASEAWIVSRLHAHSALDHAEALEIAQRQRLALPRREGPVRSSLPSLEPAASPCLRQVAEITPALFFHRLGAILDRAPDAHRQAIKERISVFTGELDGPPPAATWSAPFAAALANGFADGLAAIRTAAVAGPRAAGSGWRMLAGSSRSAEPDALSRAARAYASLGAPMREDLLALACDRDETGHPLLGSQRYRLRFPRDGVPPVHDFWWLSVWPPAPLDHRHGIGDRNDLALEPDGSLEILIQTALPDPAHIMNWLPAPEGELSLLMRLYSPRDAALAETWRMPPVERIEAGRRPGRRPRHRARAETEGKPPTHDSRAELAWRSTP